MKNVKKYWFYIEPYVFIFKGSCHYVIYNTFNGTYLKYSITDILNKVITKLKKINNGYCIMIDDVDLLSSDLTKFVSELRESFSGDLIDASLSDRPFVFAPNLKINEFYKYSPEKVKSLTGWNILKNLTEVTFYLNSKCDQECKYCSIWHKQFMACMKKNAMPDMELLKSLNLLSVFESVGVSAVNFIGGDVFQYKFLKQLNAELCNYTFKKTLSIHYENLLKNKNSISCVNNIDEFKLLLTNKVKKEEIRFLNQLMLGLNIVYCFVISTEDDLLYLSELENECLNKIEYKVLYTGDNICFFEENMYLNCEDILDVPITKMDIFRRQTLNEHFYGRLTVYPNGDTFANLNNRKIGNLFNQTLAEVVYKEMNNGKSWFYTRDEGECRDCCNRYLCPSPSNYELVMKKMNLCNICM